MPRFYMQCKDGSLYLTDLQQKAHVARLTAWCEKDVTPVQNAAGITRTMAPRDSLTLDEYDIERLTADVHEYYRNLCAAIDGKAEIIVKLPEVRRVLSVMEACFKSDEIHQTLKVDI